MNELNVDSTCHALMVSTDRRYSAAGPAEATATSRPASILIGLATERSYVGAVGALRAGFEALRRHPEARRRRALIALLEDPESQVQSFLLEFAVASPEELLALRLQLPELLSAVEAAARHFERAGKKISDAGAWAEVLADSFDLVTGHLGRRGRDLELAALARGIELPDGTEARVVSGLSPAELLLAARSQTGRRGWAGSPIEHRAIENLRRRAHRRRDALATHAATPAAE